MFYNSRKRIRCVPIPAEFIVFFMVPIKPRAEITEAAALPNVDFIPQKTVIAVGQLPTSFYFPFASS